MAPKRPIDEPATSKASHGKRLRKHSPAPISTGSSNMSASKTSPSTDMGTPPLPVFHRNEQEKQITELAQLIQRTLIFLSAHDEAELGPDLKLAVEGRRLQVDVFLHHLARQQPLHKPSVETARHAFKPLPLPPESAPEVIHDLVETINPSIIEIVPLYTSFLSKLTAQPAPSEYAKAEVWSRYQEQGLPILCLRPREMRGLPLVMLHEVFRLFAIKVRTSLPDTPIAFHAKRVAQDLCGLMPSYFEDKQRRRKKFNDVTDTFIKWQSEQTINAQSEVHGGKVDALHVNAEGNRVLIIREDKVEIGSGGDPYMQASRDYQILVSQAKENDQPLIKEGYPVFILTLAGPQLLVCGGFWDGKFPIVEPLTPPCLMLPDFLEEREDTLARALYALRHCVDYLKGPRPSLSPFEHGVPRVFQNFQPLVGDPQPITFLRPLYPSYGRLVFFAEVYESSSPAAVVVKFRSRRYGKAVHIYLAGLGLAPTFRGTITLEGTPTGYVMDFLKPPAQGRPGWITLFDFGKSKVVSNRDEIRKSLDELLHALKSQSFAHGDLRSNNILIRVDGQGAPQVSDGTAHIRVVDFDWAGTSGEVRYPETLNKDIQWSASIGDPIECSHDKAMVDRWWKDEFSFHP